MSKQKILGEDIWKNKVEKINSEVFLLTYGSMVVQLMKDYEDVEEVNKQLDKMGYNIGIRLIEDLLAISGINTCGDLKETAEVIAKVGFKSFLNVVPTIAQWSADNKEFSLIFSQNPLGDYVELPPNLHKDLWYSNILCGVIRGALEMVHLQVEANFIADNLRGHDHTEIRIKFIKFLQEQVPNAED
ncbi:TRAPP I complex, partial [Neoconidiobolus thromboides FSU 785]